MDKEIKQDLKDFTVMLFEHNRLLMSLKKELEDFKSENRIRNSVIELRLDRLETRVDTHTHQQYKQGATRKLYKDE
tara:strand:+ start:135 stop:362 length:228 start_codon:yes stop_codon:yes gene_type:complete